MVLKEVLPKVILRPAKKWQGLDLKELWRYRELIYFLTWRDIKVRYKQAVLGISWALFQPILTTLISWVVFGILLKVESNGLPYPVFVMSALMPWQLFATSLQKSSISLVGNSNLLTKIYFPRLIIPISAVLAVLADFIISFLVLIVMMFIFRITPTWQVLWVIPLILMAILTALAVGLWLSAMNVQYRDVQHMVPFIVQIWMYASPIVYPIETIPAGLWRTLYGLNPMVGVIQGFRWALLGAAKPDLTMWVSIIVVIILFISGLFYFRKMEKTFADIV